MDTCSTQMGCRNRFSCLAAFNRHLLSHLFLRTRSVPYLLHSYFPDVGRAHDCGSGRDRSPLSEDLRLAQTGMDRRDRAGCSYRRLVSASEKKSHTTPYRSGLVVRRLKPRPCSAAQSPPPWTKSNSDESAQADFGL